MPFDPFDSTSDSLISPAKVAFAITPDDAAQLPGATKAIYVGTGGDIAFVLIGSDTPVLFRNVPDGSIMALRLRAVRAAGTTAADLVGLA